MLNSLLLFVSSSIALAGPVVTNVRVCGTSMPYDRYGELSYAVFGNSDTGLKYEIFRIKGYLGIEPLAGSKRTSADEIADLISALSRKGNSLCLRGNLETVQRPDRTYYYLYPKQLEVTEPAEGFLRPSELPGLYQVPQRKHKSGRAAVLALAPINDSETGRKYYFVNLSDLLRLTLTDPCKGAKLANSEPYPHRFAVERKEKARLHARFLFECNAQRQDLLEIQLEFQKLDTGRIQGLMTVERPSLNKTFTVEFFN